MKIEITLKVMARAGPSENVNFMADPVRNVSKSWRVVLPSLSRSETH